MTARRREIVNSRVVCPGGDRHVALWRNVILQAVTDATLKIRALQSDQITAIQKAHHAQLMRIREGARQWIAAQNKDFQLTCDLAGLDHSRVYEFAIAEIRKAEARERLTREF